MPRPENIARTPTNGTSLSLAGLPHDARPDLTVVVPTRDEAGNVGPLLARLRAAVGGRRVEVLFVDDSDDETPDRVRAEVADPAGAGAAVAVRLLHREPGERAGGLGGAVLAGLRQARAEWVVVMDGDLQHPPELALRLPDVGRARGLDLVAASRRVAGGTAAGLAGPTRHAVSGTATRLAKAAFPRRLAGCSDPMSGLFAVRVAALELDALRPDGFKILMEILVRSPRLRTAEVPFVMRDRFAGRSKASLGQGLRFARQLVRLKLAARPGGARGSLRRAVLFGLVGLTGLVVNSAVLWELGQRLPGLHYLLAAAIATEASTTWLFVLTERLVFRGPKPGSAGSRALRFFLLNHIALVVRLPLLALLVDVLGLPVVPANALTLVLLFLVRFVVADGAIYRPRRPQPPRDPMRVIVDMSVPPGAPAESADVPASPVPAVPGSTVPGSTVPAPRSGGSDRYLPYRYEIPGIATVGSQVRLRELEYFRAQHLGHDTDIRIRVGAIGRSWPRRHATMTETAAPPAVEYSEHLGRWGANFDVRMGEPIVVTVAPALAHSPHVVYTNVLEALLRFVAVSRGAMLLHSACVELAGVGMLISAETDTGKTGTVLRMVRELGARFLSDDMTVLFPDGRVGCFPKPLTISAHTLRAVSSDELTRSEWRRLQWQSRLHSKEGRQFAMTLSRLNLPIMGINALTQRLVPPPKYTVDRLLPCTILPSTTVTELFVISRGPHGGGELDRADAMRTLLANTEDAYQFPPFRQLAPAVRINGDDHDELRRKERAVLASALGTLRCRWLSTPDFSWADEIARLLGSADRAPRMTLA